jgi:hypothetical protein
MSSNGWLIISFLASFVPSLFFLAGYAFRTRWEDTVAGRVIFFMATVLAISYGLSVLTLLFPTFFHDARGETIRILIRFLLSVMQWSLLWLLFKVQHYRSKSQKEDKDSR